MSLYLRQQMLRGSTCVAYMVSMSCTFIHYVHATTASHHSRTMCITISLSVYGTGVCTITGVCMRQSLYHYWWVSDTACGSLVRSQLSVKHRSSVDSEQ
eukprot:25315-Eustigmatos_ZCMA.PRE.1